MSNAPGEKAVVSRVSPIEELRTSRNDLLKRFAGGKVTSTFHETYTEILDHYFRRSLEESEAGRMFFRRRRPFTLVAAGGYGRKELSLHSDVDLIILFRSRIPADARMLVESVLYPLWDVGLDLGHGIRTIRDCVDLARRDFEVLTSLLDGRFLCGDPELFFSLMESIGRKVITGKTERFGLWLQESEKRRMAAFGDASDLLEPNLKDGIGGLRDYHQILWLSKILFHLSVPRDLEHTGILSHREYAILRENLDFIGLVRNHLHRMSGRRNDRLAFEFQEGIATALGFEHKDELLPVEQFLSALHSAMASIKSIHRSFLRSNLPGKVPKGRDSKPEFLSQFIESLHEEIRITDPASLPSHRGVLMEVFGWIASKGYHLALETKRLIRESLHLVDEDFRGSREIVDTFLSILKRPRAFDALEQMDEVGLLGAFLPEFDHVRGRVHFDSYHLHPVGAHLLLTLKNIKSVGREKNILLPAILSDLKDPEPLLLASLLHDIGKVGRGHARRGAVIAGRILERIGYEKSAAEDVLFLISHHLLLAVTATRRDLNDEKAVVQCARVVGTVERLKMLHLLTYADSKATGPRAWNEWIENLVTELFFKILHLLEQQELATPDASKRIRKNLQQVRKTIGGRLDPNDMNNVFEVMSPRYLLETEPREMVRHIDLYGEILPALKADSSEAFAFEARKQSSETAWEILFMAKDRPGLFSDIAAVFALNNINILSAHIYTWLNGTAVDLFRVEAPLDPIFPEQLWRKTRADLSKVLAGTLSIPERLEEKRTGDLRKRKMIRSPEVRIDNESSDFFTLVEVFADDHVGLLYQITRTLFQQRLDIRIAKIATRGDQIADIFYVRDLEGQKVENPAQVEEIRKSLKSAVGGEQ
ncbi:MAG: [protein-PII] uridylyltransferase [Desulfobacteraceae bacterium]|nr:MAG: [protein-PII] uridylyltransferase [Desulfobacteraceae bacterium]